MPIVVDAHQHVWDLEKVDYPWLTPEYGPLNRTFEAGELGPQLKKAGVDATVLVQAANSYEDTKHMLSVADEHDFVSGVVGWVPLIRPAETRKMLEHFRRHPKFKGIRHLIHEEPDPDWLLQSTVMESLGILDEQRMTFDVVSVLPRHLEHVSTIAERHPSLKVVIDHLSKPPIRDRGWAPWAPLLARAAEHQNVYAKVSGLNTASHPENWSAEDLKPYIDHALKCFGANRLMFGSDWPVAILAGDYQKVWEETNKCIMGLDRHERASLLGGTAKSFYRLVL
jgi:L-fuconolactonase